MTGDEAPYRSLRYKGMWSAPASVAGGSVVTSRDGLMYYVGLDEVTVRFYYR